MKMERWMFMFGQTQRLQRFKGFVFTLDALFALVIILLAASVLLVFAIQPISFVSSKAISSSHIASSLASIKLKDLATDNIFVRNIISFQKDNWNQYMGDQFHSASAPSGPQLYLLFNFTPGARITSPPVVWNDYLIFGAGNNKIYAINSSNGKFIWSSSITGNVTYSPIVFNNTVIFDTTANFLYILDLTNGRQIRNNSLTGRPSGAPYIFENMLFVPLNNSLTAFYLNGSKRWNFTSNTQFTTPVATKGLLVTSTNKQSVTNYIYFLSFTPTQVWNATKIVSASFSQSPAGYIKATASSTTVSQLTVVFWIYPVNNGYWGNSGNYWENAVSGSRGCWNNYYFYIEAGSNPPKESWSITNSSGTQFRNFPGVSLTPNAWQQLVGVYNGSALIVYLNGKQIGSPVAAKGTVIFNGTMISGNNPVSSGAGCNPISGNLANVQIYSTALTPQQIQQLYLQGINSPPIPNAGLVGWWPLQGNANDYSPYNNFGTPYNVIYNSTYPAPITGQTIVGNKIIFGSGKGVYAYYFNGSSAWNFSTGANTVTGPISSYKNKVFFQTTGGIYALYSNNGSPAWPGPSGSSLPTSSGDYPVIGGDKVYAIWGDNKIYIYNATNGNIISSITVPIVGSGHTSLALANGNLYVGMGNNIYAFGNCKADPNDTVLNAIARFYSNKQYFCANMLGYFAFSNSSQQMNYGLWVNGTFLPSISTNFNGVNAYVVVAGSTLLSPPSFTVVFWVRLPVPDRKWAGIVDRGRDATPMDWYFLGPNQNCGNGQGIIFSANTTELCYNWGDPYWHFVAGVYNNTSHVQYLYVDGVLKGSSGGGPTRSTQKSYPLVIGARSPDFAAPFNGSIANVQIYSTALTPQQIQQLYLQGINSPPIPNAGLVGWWPLNGDTNDYSGWFNTGFPFNGVTFNATSYSISFTTSSSSTAFGAGFNAYGSTNATRAFDIAIAGWSK
jgi:outer membrane protein assembly factor BamB